MVRTIYVTRAQILAAQTLVARSAVTGRLLSPVILKIANARPANSPKSPDRSSTAADGARLDLPEVPNRPSRSRMELEPTSDSDCRSTDLKTIGKCCRRSSEGAGLNLARSAGAHVADEIRRSGRSVDRPYHSTTLRFKRRHGYLRRRPARSSLR